MIERGIESEELGKCSQRFVHGWICLNVPCTRHIIHQEPLSICFVTFRNVCNARVSYIENIENCQDETPTLIGTNEKLPKINPSRPRLDSPTCRAFERVSNRLYV